MKKIKLITKKTFKITQNSIKNHQISINFFKPSPAPPQLSSLAYLTNPQNHQKPLKSPPKHPVFTPPYPKKDLLDQPKPYISQPWQSSYLTASLPQEHTL